MYDRLTFASAATAWLLAWLPAPAALAASPCHAAPTPECVINEAVEFGRTQDENLHVWSQAEAGSAWLRLGSRERARDHFDRAFALWDKTYRGTGVMVGNTEQMAQILTSAGDPRGAVIFDEMAEAILAYDGPWPYDHPAEPANRDEADAIFLTRELGRLVTARAVVGDTKGVLKSANMAHEDKVEVVLLVSASETLARNGYTADASAVLAKAQRMWRESEGPDERKRITSAIFIEPLTWLDRLDEALGYVEALANADQRDDAFSSIANVYMERGHLEAAARVIEKIFDGGIRAGAWRDLAFYQARAGNAETAETLLGNAGDYNEHFRDDYFIVYCQIAAARAAEGDIDGALEYLEERYLNSERPYLLDLAFSTVAERLIETGGLEGAETVLQRLNPETRLGLARELAVLRARAGDAAGALALARSVEKPESRVQALISVALGMEGIVCFYGYNVMPRCQ